MVSSYEQLPDDIEALKSIIANITIDALDASEKLESTTKAYENQIKYLEEKIRLLNYKLFGRKSEKLSPEDELQGHLFDEVETHFEEVDAPEKEDVIRVSGHTRKKGGRRPLPEDLPRKDVEHDIPAEEKICACGAELSHIGDEVSEKLAVKPAEIWVERHVRLKYACKSCDGVVFRFTQMGIFPV